MKKRIKLYSFVLSLLICLAVLIIPEQAMALDLVSMRKDIENNVKVTTNYLHLPETYDNEEAISFKITNDSSVPVKVGSYAKAFGSSAIISTKESNLAVENGRMREISSVRFR